VATFKQLHSGNWRVQIRRKGRYLSETFRRRKDADEWALDVERRIDRGEVPTTRAHFDPTTFAHLIDLHIEDMREVGRTLRRSKAFTLDALKKKLGCIKIKDLSRERLVQFGKDRAIEGAGPVTVSVDLAYIRTVLAHAAAVRGIAVAIEPVDLARIALKRLGLIGKSRERNRRPTLEEIERIVDYFEANPRQIIPVGRIVQFAVATAMRQEEICRVLWQDLNLKTRLLIVRDRKDPRDKDGNDQKIPLLDATGIDPCAILEEQRPFSRKSWRIFPYRSRSIGTAFRRACKELGIQDLHFHDLRHEATSRLFESGFSIEQVALVTGHKDWKMLKRYANLRPEQLHELRKKQQAITRPLDPIATQDRPPALAA
jgi:integrase